MFHGLKQSAYVGTIFIVVTLMTACNGGATSSEAIVTQGTTCRIQGGSPNPNLGDAANIVALSPVLPPNLNGAGCTGQPFGLAGRFDIGIRVGDFPGGPGGDVMRSPIRVPVGDQIGQIGKQPGVKMWMGIFSLAVYNSGDLAMTLNRDVQGAFTGARTPLGVDVAHRSFENIKDPIRACLEAIISASPHGSSLGGCSDPSGIPIDIITVADPASPKGILASQDPARTADGQQESPEAERARRVQAEIEARQQAIDADRERQRKLVEQAGAEEACNAPGATTQIIVTEGGTYVRCRDAVGKQTANVLLVEPNIGAIVDQQMQQEAEDQARAQALAELEALKNSPEGKLAAALEQDRLDDVLYQQGNVRQRRELDQQAREAWYVADPARTWNGEIFPRDQAQMVQATRELWDRMEQNAERRAF